MNKLFDTHAHYFDRRFNEIEGGVDSILSSEEFRGVVGKVVNVGADPTDPYISINQAKKYDFMYAAVGIHPSDAQNLCTKTADEEIAAVKALIADPAARKENKVVAIGEIGFDYYWQPVDKTLQYEYFDKQMLLAAKYDLPVIVHNREAHGDTFDMICKHKNVRGIIHSCSMSAEMVREVVKRGWYVSFSGTVTFKTAENVRRACMATPLDRLLIETDAPYLAPVPYRGKINHSIYMQKTAETVGELHGLSYDEIAKMTSDNAERLFFGE